MPQLLIVENQQAPIVNVPGAEIVLARDYLTSQRYSDMKRAKVFNLCHNHSYQSEGYYVSLLAAARGHRPLPSLGTIQNLRQLPLIKIASGELDRLIQKSLAGLRGPTFELSIYFGKNLASKYDRLCQALFDHFPAPLLRATLRLNGSWKLHELRIIATKEVPASHHEFFRERAQRYFARPRTKDVQQLRYDLAILLDPNEADAPSNPKAIERFVRAAKQVGIRAFPIGRAEYPRIAEYDALFIRATTSVTNHTFRFASRAKNEGLIVVDDPDSILKCCNKVYQAELFKKHDIPCPRTLVVHKGNRSTVADVLGLPCVLKQPDSAFSKGVVKAYTQEELKQLLDQLLSSSDLVVAQAYVESEFDWRIGVLGGRPLYACRYYMARGHWQIQKNKDGGGKSFGRHETMSVLDAPDDVVGLALRTASHIGDGLYGVDIKVAGGEALVIEVNDNPNIEAGVEDLVEKEALYLNIMRHFVDRLERKGVRQ